MISLFFRYFEMVKAPGVYSDTNGQDVLEYIGMAIAVLLAVGAFAVAVARIVRERSSAINSSW